MGLSRAEQETTLRWDEEEKVVHVWSASPVTWRRLARLGIRPVRETTTKGEPTGKFYTLPLEQFRWGLKRQGAGRPVPEAFRRRRPLNQEPGAGQDAAGGLA